MEQPNDKESAWAGVLNGSMIASLGGIIPAVLLWQMVVHWSDLVSGQHPITALQTAQGLSALFFSAMLFRFGARMIASHVMWLRGNRKE